MDSCAEQVISVMKEENNWRSVVRSRAKQFNNYSKIQYLGKVIKKIIQQELPVSLLEECLEFLPQIGIYSQDLNWVKSVAAYGNREAFLFLSQKEDFFAHSVTIFEVSAGEGNERLQIVLQWLFELGALQEMFNDYLTQVNAHINELDSGHKTIFAVIIEHLAIDAYTYDWGAKDSPVNNWLSSLRDQV